MNKNGGFTLIELLVVVLIIGILAGEALPQYEKSVEKSRMVSAITMAKAVRDAEDVHFLATGAYTNDMDALDIQYSCPKGFTCSIQVESDSKMTFDRNGKGYGLIVGFTNRSIRDLATMYCYAVKDSAGEKFCSGFGNKMASSDSFARYEIR
ncbi:MAG: prepilin-type N-terminal cleavage/methylation domain-containing protein [Elusimicrobiaceae bacterium]|uniref:type IV pilin protein n=1 Tax=Candidatus Avelusimicrobium faecicola TaxID=3416205 RepID=UPI002A781A7B|nr:prepilin-type N-terminal cleavage/methylation domain-containing protein [Elusimicrobiaceae bacterium]